MERNRRRLVTGLAATGVVAAVLAGGGTAIASAASAPSAAQPAVVTASNSASGGSAGSGSAGLAASTAAHGKGGARFLRRHHGDRLVLRTSASYLGLTPQELRAQLTAGKSLTAIAAAKGKPVSGLENAILAAVTKRVHASKLTAARQAAVIADVKGGLSAFVTAIHPFERLAHRLGDPGAAPATPAPSASASAPATSGS